MILFLAGVLQSPDRLNSMAFAPHWSSHHNTSAAVIMLPRILKTFCSGDMLLRRGSE
jgi:hypothetical protein